jgi:hypothetical protein
MATCCFCVRIVALLLSCGSFTEHFACRLRLGISILRQARYGTSIACLIHDTATALTVSDTSLADNRATARLQHVHKKQPVCIEACITQIVCQWFELGWGDGPKFHVLHHLQAD